MSDFDKINKMLEAAVVSASQDGLEAEELVQVSGAIMVVPTVGPAIQQLMAENDIETDDVDLGYESLMESISDFSANLAANLEQYELIEVDESYAEEVVSVLGNSAALQNLCIGIALAVSAGDGEISELESEAINLLASKMDLFIGDIATMIAESVLEAVAESK
jgi:hypothetical protein